MDIEKLAKKIFDECAKDNEPVTMEQAREMAQMEIGAKGMSRGATTVSPTDKARKSTHKTSDEKKMLFNNLLGCLNTVYEGNVQVLTENKLITVKIDEKTFKIDLIECRK